MAVCKYDETGMLIDIIEDAEPDHAALKTVYVYDERGVYLRAEKTGRDHLESKAQGKDVWLLPPNATFTAPALKDGYASVWDDPKWTQVEDHRGVKYWLPGDLYGSAGREMTELGPFPEHASLTAPLPTEEDLAEQALTKAKAEREEAVSKIVVEVDGMRFDGDEVAQGRMGRTVAAAIADGADLATTKRQWVLADNSVASVTVKQLAQALKLAGDAQTALWVAPYQASE